MVDTLDRIHDAFQHYSDQGLFPREATLTAHWNWYWISIHMASGSTLVQQFLFLIHAVFAFFMMIGYKTKLFTFLCWFMVASHQGRNNVNGHGGDMYMRIILFWALFLPTSSYFSVDRALSGKRRKVKKPLVVNGGTIAVIGQICIVYVFSYLHKTGDDWHLYGTSTHYALMLDYFRLPMGDFFLHFPTLMKFLSFAVLYFELWGALLFFVPVYTGPFRALGSILFMIMHVGFGSCMGLGIFSPISCTSLSTLLTPWFWDELVFPWLSKGVDKIQILYYKNTPGEPFSILLSDFLLPPDSFTVSPSDSKLVDEQFSWLAVERQGTTYTRFEAFEQVCKISPLLWPIRMLLKFKKVRSIIHWIFLRLPPFVGFLYRNLARPKSAEIEAASSLPDKLRLRRKLRKLVVSAIAVFLIVHIALWNCGNKHYKVQLPEGTHWIAMATRLDQMWNMFSPGPPRINWWYTIEGVQDDGTRIEIWRNGLEKWKGNPAPYSVAKPDNLGEVIGNHRWIKYYEFVNWAPEESVNIVRLNFGRYICREYNKRNFDGAKLWKFNIMFRSEDNLLDGTKVPRFDEVFWSHQCFEKIGNPHFRGDGSTPPPAVTPAPRLKGTKEE